MSGAQRSTPPAGSGSTAASAVTFTPTGTVGATNVQAAIAEVAAEAASAVPNRLSKTEGRQILATNLADGLHGQGLLNAFTFKQRHVALAACSNLRLLYSNGQQADSGLAPIHPMSLTVALETTTGKIVPVTFAGQSQVTVSPYGSRLSDPIPVDLALNEVFYTRVFQTCPFGSVVFLSADAAIGSSSVQIASLPVAGSLHPSQLGGQGILIGSEQLVIDSISGAPGSYTLRLQSPTTVFHATGAQVGQQGAGNGVQRNDYNEGGDQSNVDKSASGTLGPPTFVRSITLTANANIGDTSIPFSTSSGGPGWLTMTLDTAGNAETIQIVNSYNNRLYLASPLTKAHASGVTAIPTVILNTSTGFLPLAIVADYQPAAAAMSILVVGDSIAAGSGFFAASIGFVEQALWGVRAFSNTGKSSETLSGIQDFVGGRGRRALMDLFDWTVIQAGTNDIYNGTITDANLRASAQALVAAVHARGRKAAIGTLIPRCASTDNFLTLANQSIPDAAREAQRTSYNDWLRAGSSGADLVIEFADGMESARNSGKFRVGSSGPYVFTDGIHPSVLGHLTMAGVLTAALPQIV